jgi:predicted CDP-diglyceride synthetase/phosphatidate cytidylyltransferase
MKREKLKIILATISITLWAVSITSWAVHFIYDITEMDYRAALKDALIIYLLIVVELLCGHPKK